MPGRSYSSTAYKYGFNGKEKDDEVSGTGNQYDYGFRIYNPRIAKFLSVDPLTKSYPMLTPYQFASNTPIMAIDLDGLEAKKSITINSDGSTTIKTTLDINVIDGTNPIFYQQMDAKSLKTIYSVDYGKGKMSDAEVQDFVSSYKMEIPQFLNGYDSKSNIHYEYQVGKVNVIPAEEFNEGGGGLNVIIIGDDAISFDGSEFLAKTVEGRVKEIGQTQNNSMVVRRDASEGTKAHETGHWLGLEHVIPYYSTGLNADRLMRDGKYITPDNAPPAKRVTNDERQMMNKKIPLGEGKGGAGRGEYQLQNF